MQHLPEKDRAVQDLNAKEIIKSFKQKMNENKHNSFKKKKKNRNNFFPKVKVNMEKTNEFENIDFV